MLVCAGACVCVCVCARVRACVCVYVLTIVSTDKILRFIKTLTISSSSKEVSQSRVLAGACAAIPLGTCTQLRRSELLSQFAQKNARGVKAEQGVFRCVDTCWGTAR